MPQSLPMPEKFKLTCIVTSRETSSRSAGGIYPDLPAVEEALRYLREDGFTISDVNITPVDKKGNPA